MLRLSIVMAAALVSAGPVFADGIHIKTAGKDDATLHAEIVSAAHRVCAEEDRLYVQPASPRQLRACIETTVERTVASANDPGLSAFHRRTLQPMVIGSR